MNKNLIGLSGKMGSGKDTVAAIINFLVSNPGLSNKTIAHLLTNPSHTMSPGEYTIKKFAGKLKEIASMLTGYPVHYFEDQDFKKEFLPEEWDYYVAITEGVDYNESKKFSTKEDAELMLSFTRSAFERLEIKTSIEKRQMTVRQLLQELGTDAMRMGLHPNVWVNALLADYNPPKMSQDFPSKWLVTDVRFENEAQAIKERGGVLLRVNRDVETGTHPSETSLDEYKFDYTISNKGSMEDLVIAVRAFCEAYDLINADAYAD